MTEKKKKHMLINDEGTYINKTEIHSLIFVTLCRIYTAVLIIVGVVAFVTGLS